MLMVLWYLSNRLLSHAEVEDRTELNTINLERSGPLTDQIFAVWNPSHN